MDLPIAAGVWGEQSVEVGCFIKKTNLQLGAE